MARSARRRTREFLGEMTAATSQKLADALRAGGLEELARRAEADEFHDFLSPHATPEMELAAELSRASVEADLAHDHAKAVAATDIRGRVINGEFDASKEESDAWAASPEGQAAFAELVRGKKRQ